MRTRTDAHCVAVAENVGAGADLSKSRHQMALVRRGCASTAYHLALDSALRQSVQNCGQLLSDLTE